VPPGTRFVGDGAVRYGDVIHERLGSTTAIVEPPPLAAIIGRMASRSPERAVSPHAVVPIYIRKPDAELAKIRGLGDQGARGAQAPEGQGTRSE
jgi:hypothetical protein